jgi:hypothetical protein
MPARAANINRRRPARLLPEIFLQVLRTGLGAEYIAVLSTPTPSAALDTDIGC